MISNLSHALTSWQLVSHAFSKSPTPKNLGTIGFVSKLDTDVSIDSQLIPKNVLPMGNFGHLFWTSIWIHFIQGCPVQRGWFEWGPDEKKKTTTQKTITDKKLEQLSITIVLEAQFGLDLRCLFRPNPNLFKSCPLLRARGSVFQILAPLNLTLTTFYPFLTTFPSSLCGISFFCLFGVGKSVHFCLQLQQSEIDKLWLTRP